MSKKELKALKNTKLLACFVLLVFGIVFIIWPNDIKDMIAKVIGIVFALAGVIEIVITAFKKEEKKISDWATIVISAVVTIFGIVCAVKPSILINMFGYAFGLIILLDGAYNVYHSFRFARKASDKWWVSLVISLGAALFGLIVITKAGDVTNGLIRFIGIALVITSIAEAWNAFSINRKRSEPKVEPKSKTDSLPEGDKES